MDVNNCQEVSFDLDGPTLSPARVKFDYDHVAFLEGLKEQASCDAGEKVSVSLNSKTAVAHSRFVSRAAPVIKLPGEFEERVKPVLLVAGRSHFMIVAQNATTFAAARLPGSCTTGRPITCCVHETSFRTMLSRLPASPAVTDVENASVVLTSDEVVCHAVAHRHSRRVRRDRRCEDISEFWPGLTGLGGVRLVGHIDLASLQRALTPSVKLPGSFVRLTFDSVTFYDPLLRAGGIFVTSSTNLITIYDGAAVINLDGTGAAFLARQLEHLQAPVALLTDSAGAWYFADDERIFGVASIPARKEIDEFLDFVGRAQVQRGAALGLDTLTYSLSYVCGVQGDAVQLRLDAESARLSLRQSGPSASCRDAVRVALSEPGSGIDEADFTATVPAPPLVGLLSGSAVAGGDQELEIAGLRHSGVLVALRLVLYGKIDPERGVDFVSTSVFLSS